VTGAELTALIPQRWPYAPTGATILTVPPDTFAGEWGGRWNFATLTAYINDALPLPVQLGIVAHELAHGRWSAPLPDLPGEEGSTALVVELFDELRVERWAIAHRGSTARNDVRGYIADSFRHPGDEIVVRNARAAALVYGMFIGHVLTGALDYAEIGPTIRQIHDQCGTNWCELFDGHLAEMFDAAPGANGTLVAIARRWDWDAIHPPLHLHLPTR
jgi:hypothetical protein